MTCPAGESTTILARRKFRDDHNCEPYRACRCYILASEPADDCPIHGFGELNRCACGRYVKRAQQDGGAHV